ncbi:DUF6603 domain-containing protein [Streptomyces sp. NPDC098789]|uniref:DUF6603 domain-containing protein n=1 Tax=Streptomyces sp. NPDC098789 TaxID=3366098 RepID=UPI0037FC6A35
MIRLASVYSSTGAEAFHANRTHYLQICKSGDTESGNKMTTPEEDENTEDSVRFALFRLEPKGLEFRVPLLDPLIPAGAKTRLADMGIGYISNNADKSKVEKLSKVTGYDLLPESMKQGPFLLVNGSAAGEKYQIYKPFNNSEKTHLLLDGNSQSAPGMVNTTVMGWVNFDRSLGPIHIGRLGAGYGEGSALILADVGLAAGGFRFETKGLGAEIPLNDPQHPKFHLDGLSMSYKSEPFTIGAELVRLSKKGYEPAVGGMAVLKTPAISVSALGFYAQKKSGSPSLFIFGVLDLSKKSVGNPQFRLEKIAAGFGYNTMVRTPKIDEVDKFPFVKCLTPDADSDDDPLKQLDKMILENPPWVDVASNEIWLAAGLQARIYEVLDIGAAVIGQFGDDVVIGLYGQASTQLPPSSLNDAKIPKIGLLELNIRGEYRSSKDTLEFDAAFTERSFLIDPDCHLTGGASVRIWFGKSQHPGEFVVTLGGYHPRVTVPKHYPVPARLGLNWELTSNIHIWGGCYAALTPHGFMTGTSSNIHGEWGPAKIDAGISLDALIEWNPLYFDVEWGAFLRAQAFGFKAELSAVGALYGPKFGGHARIKICGIGIDVDFGASRKDSMKKEVTPDEFRRDLLPGGKGSTIDQVNNEKVLTVGPTNGLLPPPTPPSKALAGAEGQAPSVWAFGTHDFEFSVGSAVPMTKVSVNNQDASAGYDGIPKYLCIRPIQKKSVTSQLDITVKAHTGKGLLSVPVLWPGEEADAESEFPPFRAELARNAVPAALWRDHSTKADPDSTGLVDGYATGVKLSAPLPDEVAHEQIKGEAWENARLELTIPKVDKTKDYMSKGASGDRLDSISAAALKESLERTVETRKSILSQLASLRMSGFEITSEQVDDLGHFSKNLSAFMDAQPQVTGV